MAAASLACGVDDDRRFISDADFDTYEATGELPGMPGRGGAAGSASTLLSNGTGGSGGGATCGASTLLADASGLVEPDDNGCGIEGSWYWFSDSAGTRVSGATNGAAPYRAGSGMCIAGSTVVDPTFAAYGAAIAFNLAEPEHGSPQPFDAAAHLIIGFEITLTGTAAQELRFSFVRTLPSSGSSPFVRLIAPGTQRVLLSEASVPSNWSVPNAGERADSRAISAIQVFVSGGSVAAPFDICISTLKPLLQ